MREQIVRFHYASWNIARVDIDVEVIVNQADHRGNAECERKQEGKRKRKKVWRRNSEIKSERPTEGKRDREFKGKSRLDEICWFRWNESCILSTTGLLSGGEKYDNRH